MSGNVAGWVEAPRTHRTDASQPTPDLGPLPVGGRWSGIRRVVEDPLITVSAVWAVATAMMFIWIQETSLALPHVDEYHAFMPIASGHEKVTWRWLWQPANEHRAPLLRLYIVGLGELFDWNFRAMLRVNLAVHAAGVLALVLATRRLRGGVTHLADAVIPLAALNPAAVDTVVCYSYAYAPVVGCLWLALSLSVTGAVYRSRVGWLVYALLAPAVAMSGGPPGQLWALGLLAAAPFVFASRGLGWLRYISPVWAAAVVAWVGVCIWATPHHPQHDVYRAGSVGEAGLLALKYAAGWLGLLPLRATWPYPAYALVLPLAYIAVSVTARLWRAVLTRSASEGNLPGWLPVLGVFVATLGLAGIIAYTRSSHHLWVPRYHFILVPIGVAGYLLLVQLRSPQTLLHLVFVLVLGSWGYNWFAQQMLIPNLRPEPRRDLTQKLRSANVPLALLATREGVQAFAWHPTWGSNGMVIGWWSDLREKRQGPFRRMDPLAPIVSIRAADGALGPGLEVVPDAAAVGYRAVRRSPAAGPETGRATYVFEVPADQKYTLWVRYRTDPGVPRRVTFQIDGGPREVATLPPAAEYTPMPLFAPRPLAAGRHTAELGFEDAGLMADFVEVVRVTDG